MFGVFTRFLQVSERGFLQKISYFDGKELPIKAGIFQTPGVFIESPGR